MNMNLSDLFSQRIWLKLNIWEVVEREIVGMNVASNAVWASQATTWTHTPTDSGLGYEQRATLSYITSGLLSL